MTLRWNVGSHRKPYIETPPLGAETRVRVVGGESNSFPGVGRGQGGEPTRFQIGRENKRGSESGVNMRVNPQVGKIDVPGGGFCVEARGKKEGGCMCGTWTTS